MPCAAARRCAARHRRRADRFSDPPSKSSLTPLPPFLAAKLSADRGPCHRFTASSPCFDALSRTEPASISTESVPGWEMYGPAVRPKRRLRPRNDGVPGRARTCDPRFHTTSAFAAAPERGAFVAWTIPSPWAGMLPAFRCRPSSLYTFPRGADAPSGLGSGSAGYRTTKRRHRKLSPTLSGSAARFPGATPN